MNLDIVLQSAVAVVNNFSNGNGTVLQEFELLVYEQACRTIEFILRSFREVNTGELTTEGVLVNEQLESHTK